MPATGTFPEYTKHVATSQPTFSDGIEAVCIDTFSGADTWTLSHTGHECAMATSTARYVRPGRRLKSEGLLQGLHTLVQGGLLICGEMNAHHTKQGSAGCSRQGNSIANKVEASGLLVTSDGKPMF